MEVLLSLLLTIIKPIKWLLFDHSWVQFSGIQLFATPMDLQQVRLPCPSPASRACSNSYPSSWWCYPTISSSVVPFSSCLQSFPAPMSQFFPSGGQSLELQHWSFQWIFRTDFLSDWLVWSPCSPRDSLKSLLQHHSSKASIPRGSTFFMVQLSHPYMTIGETIALTRQTFVGKVMSLLFNKLSRLVMAFQNLPAMPETWLWSLGWEESLERGKTTHSSILT